MPNHCCSKQPLNLLIPISDHEQRSALHTLGALAHHSQRSVEKCEENESQLTCKPNGYEPVTAYLSDIMYDPTGFVDSLIAGKPLR